MLCSYLKFIRPICVLFAFVGGISLTAIAQSYPAEWTISPDGRMITVGKAAPSGLYDSSVIRSVYLNFPQSNYWTQLTNNYSSQTEIPASMVVDGVTYDSVGVRFRGNTSYTNLGSSQKKSFKVSVDYAHDGQELMGYKTLKFNNAYEDKSMLREVFYLHQIGKHIPAAKANFIHLYLNNQDWGLYPNIQQLNKQFYKEWFLSNDGASWRADQSSSGSPGGPGGGGWGDGTAALNYLGSDTASYQNYYTLKSSDVNDPWTKLVNVCNLLNNSGTNISTALPPSLDIDRTLWFLASEIAWTDDDSYVMKGKMDYYVYYEPESGRLTPIEYDGNSSLETSYVTTWTPFYHETNANYPLLNKILAVPAWRQRYLAHMRSLLQDEMDTTICIAMLTNYQNQMDALVNSDPKKIYTYAQFTSEMTVLKNFVRNRRAYLSSNTELAQVAPVISDASYSNQNGQLWTVPAPAQAVNVTTHVTSVNGIDHVTLYYATGLTGNFTTVQMYDDGNHNDTAANDGIYGAAIPAQTAGSYVRWYVEATAANTSKSVCYLPKGAEHDVYMYIVTPLSVSGSVVVNELMASNTTTVADNTGEYDDWFELYNNSASAVDIGGWYLTDNMANLDKWQIPSGTTIPADGYLTFWADEDSSQGSNHCNFKLSASGEFIWLLNENLEIVDSVSFGTQQEDLSYARIPNGTGSFVIKNATFGFNNETAADVSSVLTLENMFKVYPNPVGSYVYVEIEALVKGYELEVRNSLGQIIIKQNADGKNTINTSEWASGIYFIKYGRSVQRLIVQH